MNNPTFSAHHLLLALCLGWGALAGSEPSPSQPAEPVVIRSLPICGAELVDPNIQELSVTFDHALVEGQWSWAPSPGGIVPVVSGAPHFLADRRTWVLPVRLQPNTAYALALNYGKERKFRDPQAAVALPWILRFTTGAAGDRDPDQALLSQATQVADALVREDFASVAGRFDATMRKGFDAQRIGEVWQTTVADYGPFKAFDSPYFKTIETYRAVIVTGRWQQAALNVQIVFDVEGRISGLMLTPATR